MKLKELLPLLILFPFIVTSCGNPQPPASNVSNPNVNIEIQTAGSESQEISTETISQNNCTGIAEVESAVEKSRTIEHVMEVQSGVSLNANGQVGFAGTDVELGATVASQFGQSYGTSETITRSITVKAPAGTYMEHVIRQTEVWTVGNATITVGGQQTIIPFKFRSGFAVELARSNQLACDNNGTISDSTQTFPTLENTPSDIPTEASGLPVGMDVQLFADKTSGRHPLNVEFNAGDSFFRDAQGVIYPCGVCNFTWYVYKNSNFVTQSDRNKNGIFRYKFGSSGDYRVVVRVCRGQGDSDCAFDAEDISVN